MTPLKQLLQRYDQIESQRLLAGLRGDQATLCNLDKKMLALFAEAYFEGYPLDTLILLQGLTPARRDALTLDVQKRLGDAKERGIPPERQLYLQQWFLAIIMLQAVEDAV